MPLFLDGARLGYGLMSDSADLTIEDIARLTDVFYIGGTKVGALCGEAVVFTKNNKPRHFMTSVKKRGALLAKGRLLGVQFDTLFTDDLYWRISRHAIDRIVLRAEEACLQILMNEEQMAELAESVAFDRWGIYDDELTIVRLATSWSTTEEDLRVLEAL